MYRKLYDPFGNEISNIIQRVSDNACIPMNEANRDYQEFLEWQANGGILQD